MDGDGRGRAHRRRRFGVVHRLGFSLLAAEGERAALAERGERTITVSGSRCRTPFDRCAEPLKVPRHDVPAPDRGYHDAQPSGSVSTVPRVADGAVGSLSGSDRVRRCVYASGRGSDLAAGPCGLRSARFVRRGSRLYRRPQSSRARGRGACRAADGRRCGGARGRGDPRRIAIARGRCKCRRDRLCPVRRRG